MRYTTKIALLSTLSTVALLTASATSGAFAPAITDMGLLRQHDTWHVGSVDAQNSSYCAMVNQFEKGVSLAFARSPDGYGSVAISFPGDVLEAGKAYDVTMQVDDQDIHHYTFNAPSARSAIIQIAQNDDFYTALAGNGTLRVSLPTVDLKFELRQFSGSYISLVGCAEKLAQAHDGPKTAAMPVPPVEKSSLAQQAQAEAATPPAPPAPAVDDAMNTKVELLKTQKELLQDKVGVLEKQVNAKNEETASIADLKSRLADKTTQYDTLQKQFIDMGELYKAEKDKSTQAHGELDTSGQRLFQAQTQLVDLKHTQSQSITTLQSQLTEKTTQYDSLQKQFIDMSGMYKVEKDKGAQDHIALDAANLHLTQLQAQLTDVQGKLTEKTAQSDALNSQLATMQLARKSDTERAAQVSAALEVSRQSLAQTQTRLSSSDQQKSQLSVQLQDQGQQTKTLLQSVQEQLDNTRRQLSMLESQMMTVALQKDDLSAQLESQKQQNRVLQASLEAKQKELILSRPAPLFPETSMMGTNPTMANAASPPLPAVFAMAPASSASILPPSLPSRNSGNRGSMPAIKSSSAPINDNWDTVVIQ